jgi:hypothetical protein
MALRLGMRLWLSAGIFLALSVAPSTASAQDNPGAVRSDDQFYSLLTSPATAAPVASKTLNSGRSESAARGTQGTELKESPSPIVASAADIPTSASLPLPMGREQTIMGMLLSFSPITWAVIVAGIVALGAILWAATPLPCLLLGHRRCSRSVRFVDHEQRWVGNCKSCGIALVRDAKGTWKRAKVTWRKPEVRPEPVQYSSRVEEVSAEAGVQPVHLDTELEAVPRVLPEPVLNGQASLIEWPVRARNDEPIAPSPVEQRAQTIASQLLDDVDCGSMPTPGTRGALFSVVDELRARCARDEHTLCAEKISIRMQQLETALQRGDETEAKLARNELKTLAGEWVDAPAA